MRVVAFYLYNSEACTKQYVNRRYQFRPVHVSHPVSSTLKAAPIELPSTALALDGSRLTVVLSQYRNFRYA